MAKAKESRAFRLSFTSTRAKKFAATLKEATKDARYWAQWGAGTVCVERRLPSGSYQKVGCLKRKG